MEVRPENQRISRLAHRSSIAQRVSTTGPSILPNGLTLLRLAQTEMPRQPGGGSLRKSSLSGWNLRAKLMPWPKTAAPIERVAQCA